MPRRLRAYSYLLSLALLLFTVSLAFPQPAPVSAQTELTAVNIIGAVNALRSSLGLAPYQVDPFLMSFAQQHAQYQADTNKLTHTHSDGTVPTQHGVLENIAYGSIGGLDVETLISSSWKDKVHTKTLLGYPTGTIGVGVASNGESTYVSLDIRPKGVPVITVTPLASSSPALNSTATATSSAAPENTAAPTGTPDTTGATIHVVEDGQSLWGIAVTYGITINDIRSLNQLPAGSSVIYVGQKLVVKLAPTATATLPPTSTQPPTATPLPSSTPTELPPTEAPTLTLASIPNTAGPIQPASPPILPLLAGALILVGGLGLFFASTRLRSA